MRSSHLWIRSGLASLSVLAACSDPVSLERSGGVLEAPTKIDFGDVPIGVVSRREVDFKNSGNGVLVIDSMSFGENFSAQTHEFRVNPNKLTLAPNASAKVTVSFQPLAAMAEPVQSSFTLVTNIADRGQVKIELQGRGVKDALLIEPAPVDFGEVLVGSSRTMPVKITNLLSSDVELLGAVTAAGTPDIEHRMGMGRFEVVSPVEQDGSLLKPGTQLASHTSTIIQVRYFPDANPGHSDAARWKLSYCRDPLCEVTLELLGKSTDSALSCAPAAIDFASIYPGRHLTRQIDCTNATAEEIQVVGWAMDPVSSPEFAVTPWTGTPNLVAGGAHFTIDVQYSPTEATRAAGGVVHGAVLVRGRSPTIGVDLAPVRVTLAGSVGGPAIDVSPLRLDFGHVALGGTLVRRILITNSGDQPLNVSAIVLDPSSLPYMLSRPDALVAPGAAQTVDVTFAPSAEGPFDGRVVLTTNDASRPEVAVEIHGIGLDLPPCQLTVSPDPLNFGVVEAGMSSVQGVRIENVGDHDCILHDLQVLAGTGTTAATAAAFTLVNGPEDDIILGAGMIKNVAVSFAPRRGGPHQALLFFQLSDPAMPVHTSVLAGTGLSITSIECPAPVTVPAGTPVTLTAIGTSIGRRIVSYEWNVTMSPAGGMGTPNQWTPDPPDQATEDFLPYLVGVYAIEVTVHDDQGDSETCTTAVTAVGHGLRVTLTWDGTGDVDLHLHNSSNTPWFQTDDCYYGERTPVWDPAFMAALGPNPQLDFDNTSQDGPENTTLEASAGVMSYTVGVHNFARAAGRTATLQIFCGGVLMPTQTFTSRPLNGNDAGNCTPNDFWTVARIDLAPNSSCTITPIDTYTASSDRCNAF